MTVMNGGRMKEREGERGGRGRRNEHESGWRWRGWGRTLGDLPSKKGEKRESDKMNGLCSKFL